VSVQDHGQEVTRETTSSSARRRRKDASPVPGAPAQGIMPPADVDSARRHMIAYFYAAYSGCNCDACRVLRPIAQKLVKSMEEGV